MRTTRTQRELTNHGTMTPMIDVVFLLLIFFVWTASFQIVEELLPGTFASKSAAPGSGAESPEPVPAESEIVVVELRSQPSGTLTVINGREVNDWPAVHDTLAMVAEIDGQTPVVIDPAASVAYGDAIRVLDLARSLGFSKVHFAAPE